jgi:cold shock CspA family protein
LKTLGRITSFDDVRGDGLFQSDDGQELYFHCVVIADGSRTIDVGVRAKGVRRVGHLGRDELYDVETVNS